MFAASLCSLAFSSFHPFLFLRKSEDRGASEMPKSVWWKVTTTCITLISHTSHCSLSQCYFLPSMCILLYSSPSYLFLSRVFLLPVFYWPLYPNLFLFFSLHHFDLFFFSHLDHTAIYFPDPSNFAKYLLNTYWARNYARHLGIGGRVKRWVHFSPCCPGVYSTVGERAVGTHECHIMWSVF